MKRITTALAICLALASFAICLALACFSALAANQTITIAPGDSITINSPAATGGPPPPSPPPPPGGDGFPPGTLPDGCKGQGFANVRIVDLSWSNPQRLVVEMGSDDAIVARFTTGATPSSGSLPHVVAVEYQSSPSSRMATLSTKPCDFGNQTWPGAMVDRQTTVTLSFVLGDGYNYFYYPQLKTGTTYFVNIKNADGASCRSNGVCTMSVDLLKSGVP